LIFILPHETIVFTLTVIVALKTLETIYEDICEFPNVINTSFHEQAKCLLYINIIPNPIEKVNHLKKKSLIPTGIRLSR